MTYYKNGIEYQGPQMGAQWYEDNGWITEAPVLEPVVAVKKYDQLKIVRAMGDDWAAKRDELEASGLLDQFYTAPYLSTADDVFAPIFASLTDTERALLDAQCQWGVE